jgi:hypothetical protein
MVPLSCSHIGGEWIGRERMGEERCLLHESTRERSGQDWSGAESRGGDWKGALFKPTHGMGWAWMGPDWTGPERKGEDWVANDLTFADRLKLVEDFLRFVMERDLGEVHPDDIARVWHRILPIWALARKKPITDQEVREAISVLEAVYPDHVLSSPGLYCAMERLMRFPVKEGQA